MSPPPTPSATAPKIVAFEVSPEEVATGDEVEIKWEVEGMKKVELVLKVEGEDQFLYNDDELADVIQKYEKKMGKEVDLGELEKDKKINVIAKHLDLVEFFESDELVETVNKLKKLDVEVEDYNPKAKQTKGKEQARATRYKLERKDETPVYLDSLCDVLKFIQAEGKKGMTIQRYKGLGEMNPEQLWETTMAPDKRTILKVTLEDAVEAEKTFTTLMGDEVEPRREFIQKYAREVRNLDI
jgi:DNA gyrase subunit B